MDSGVLIGAVAAGEERGQRISAALLDPNRRYASSVFVQLEVLPKPAFHKIAGELRFLEGFFKLVEVWAPAGEPLTSDALAVARTYGLSAMDALHVAAAVRCGAEELLTTERPTSPLHRVTELRVTTLHA